jgi:hypothetical protein
MQHQHAKYRPRTKSCHVTAILAQGDKSVLSNEPFASDISPEEVDFMVYQLSSYVIFMDPQLAALNPFSKTMQRERIRFSKKTCKMKVTPSNRK